MPKKKLNRTKSAMIQVMVFEQDKIAFDAWCMAHGTTMSEVIRKEITPYIESASIQK